MLFQEFAEKNKINWKQIEVKPHAIKRVRERFNGWENHKDDQIKGNLRILLRNSKYVSEIIDEQNKLSYLFVNDKKAIYLSEDFKEINTVMVHTNVSYSPLKEILIDLHKKEIRKITRRENAKVRKLNDLKDDLAIELAILKKRVKRTRSEIVKQSCNCRIKAIYQTVEQYETEIKALQDEKRQISRSMAAII